MKRRFISIFLILTIIVSIFSVSTATANAATGEWKNGSLPVVTLGVGEKVYVGEIGNYSGNATIDLIGVLNGHKGLIENSKYATLSNKCLTGKKVGTTYVKGWDSRRKKLARCIKVVVKSAPTKVTTNVTNITLGIGETYTIWGNATNNSYNSKLTWSTSNKNVASLKQDRNGTKATITAKHVGTATIKVRTYNGKVATCKVTVKRPPSRVTFNKSVITLKVGQTYNLYASVNSSAGLNTARYVYRSTNSNVAKVTSFSGSRVTIKAVKKGTAYITVKTYNGKAAQCKVRVI